MTKHLLAKAFDPNTLAAIEFLAGEDRNAILAAWFRMLALAARDPEGCVRLTPGLTMTTAELADCFHCPAEAVEAAVLILEQLQLLTRTEEGTLRLQARAGTGRRSKAQHSAAASETATEKETEKEKRKEAKEKSKEKNKKRDIAAAISDTRRQTEPETKKPVTTPDKDDQTAKQTGQTRQKGTRLIPTGQLPEPARRILEAWNALPLDNMFQGLYPAMLKRLEALLEQYGEEALRKAVSNVADSRFLLGNSRNNRGWSITLGWMLNPEHLENILQGKYQDKKPRGDSLLFQPGDEAAPFSNGFYGTVVD